MTTRNIMLAFPATIDSDGHGFSYFDDPRIEVSTYEANGKGIDRLRTQLSNRIDDALNLLVNHRHGMIACKDGTVFLLAFRYGWGYEIFGPDRKCASGCRGMKDWTETQECARKHAEELGGIAWECVA